MSLHRAWVTVRDTSSQTEVRFTSWNTAPPRADRAAWGPKRRTNKGSQMVVAPVPSSSTAASSRIAALFLLGL